MTVQEMMGQMAAVRTKHFQAFQRTFGVSLKPYWHNLTGFDIVKFDDEVVKSGEGNCGQKVIEVYGQEAQDLIMQILDDENAIRLSQVPEGAKT